MITGQTLDGIARLGYLGCIRVSGADAAAFLHAQLTNDVAHLSQDEARLAGFCSAKGRLQASFVAWRSGATDILLACSADLLAATLKRLSMFVLRMRCRLSDASAEYPVFGLAGKTAADVLADSPVWGRRDSAEATALRLPDAPGSALGLWIPRSSEGKPAQQTPSVSPDVWRWLQVKSGLAFVEAKTVDLFVPQMINFELLGGVDFQKGCYPGQEVVARSQYRGTLKRRMYLFESEAAAAAGQEVYSAADPSQPAGVVVNVAPTPKTPGSTILVELKSAALDRGSLHLGQPAGPELQRRELPYAVPVPVASPG